MRFIRIVIILGVIILSRFDLAAQRFDYLNSWKKNKKQVNFLLGCSNFFGDLGGLDQTGTHYSPIDMDVLSTRVAFGIGYQYRLLKWLAVTSQFNYINLSGDDKLTNERFRNNRNLNFKCDLFEVSGRLELIYTSTFYAYHFNRYHRFSNYLKRRTWGIGGFIGVGGYYFNTKGRDQKGEWFNLRDMHTEGQGLPNGPSVYNNYGICIPFGVTAHIIFNREISIGMEINYRKTFTDYLDDVSGVYYDKSAIANAYGAKAAYFADPNKGLVPGQTNSGNSELGSVAQKRGDPTQNDAYLTLQLTLGYILKTKKTRRIVSKF